MPAIKGLSSMPYSAPKGFICGMLPARCRRHPSRRRCTVADQGRYPDSRACVSFRLRASRRPRLAWCAAPSRPRGRWRHARLSQQCPVDDRAHLLNVHCSVGVLGFAFEGNEQKSRNAAYAKECRETFFLVHIYIKDTYSSGILYGERLHDGCHRLAGAAPGGVKVDHGGQVALIFPLRIFGKVVNLFLKLRCRQLHCFHGLLFLIFGRRLRRGREAQHDSSSRSDRSFLKCFHGMLLFVGAKIEEFHPSCDGKSTVNVVHSSRRGFRSCSRGHSTMYFRQKSHFRENFAGVNCRNKKIRLSLYPQRGISSVG